MTRDFRFSLRRLIVHPALILALTLTVNGQQATPDQPLATTGSLSGFVVTDNGNPISEATVFVRRINTAGPGRTITTNNEGRFELNNLDRGLYSVTANAPAYVMAPREPDTPAPLYRVGDSIRLELIRGGIITGTVTNAANDPVVAVRVRALMIRDANGRELKTLPPSGQTGTDDRGIYRIYGLVPGTYIVEAGGPTISVTTAVTPYDLDTSTFGPSSTRDGATEMTVSPGQESSMDIRYRGERGRSISGTIRKLGQAGATVSLTSANSGWTLIGTSFQIPGAKGFEFHGISDGVYDLVAQENIQIPGLSFGELALSEPHRVTVKGNDVSGIELVIKPLATVSGRLLLQPSTATECAGKRRPLFAETMVTIQRSRKRTEAEPSAFLRPGSAVASPDRNGELVWRNLGEGQYSFAPRFFARYWYLQSITAPPLATSASKPASANQRTDAARNWTTIKLGERMTGLTITLAEGAGSLRGKLEVPEGTKLSADLDLYLVPAEKEKADDVLRFFVAEMTADGSFSADNLPPGRYWLLPQLRSGTERWTTSKLQLPDSSEIRLKLRRTAEAAKSEIEIKPCQNVTDYRLRPEP